MSTTHTRVGPPKFSVWTGTSSAGELVLDHDVVALQVSSSLDQPTSRWSVTLLPRSSDQAQTPADVRRASFLYKSLHANQVVTIGFQERGGILLGLIDGVSRTATHAGPNAAVGLTVTGSGIGKVLARDSIVRATLNVNDYPTFKEKVDAALGADNPVTQDLPGIWGPTTRDGTPTFLSQSVQDVLDWLLEKAPSLRLPVLAEATGGDGRPSDYFDLSRCITTWHDGRIWSETPSSYDGGIWDFIRSILDRDFYECWVDCLPPGLGQSFPTPILVVRPRPFDEPAHEFLPVAEEPGLTWDDLRTLVDGEDYHEIDLSEVLSESLGVSDSEAFAFYVVTSASDLIANSEAQSRGLYYPVFDTYIAKKFGIKRYESSLSLAGADVTRKAAGDEDYLNEVSAEVVEARNRLFNWYRLAPFFESGSVQVVGRDRFRPGDPVFLPWVELQYGDQRGALYYCTGVTWSWSYGSHYVSTLTLTRGHNDSMVTALKAEILADAPASNPSHYAAAG